MITQVNHQAEKITIAVAEDHALYRQSIIDHLKAQGDFEIVIEAENGEELLQKIAKIKPMIVLLDLRMPVLNGREALVKIKSHYPTIKTIILSYDNNAGTIVETKVLGASAYVDKAKTSSHDFFSVIRNVHNGKHKFEIEQFLNGAKVPECAAKINEKFTNREKAIMPLMAKKHTSAEIGDKLKINTRTVEWHRSNIFHKSNCKSFEDFVYWYNVNFSSNEGS